MRTGIGYDVHKFSPDSKLILGGVNIDYKMGLEGHSDADVLIHAIMDSLLGAASLGDIGTHFPDTDSSFKDISSLKLLSIVKDLIKDKGFKILNIDSILIMQEPKVSPYIEEMRINISNTLDIPVDLVSVKATTEEHLGFTGNMLGIKSVATCLID